MRGQDVVYAALDRLGIKYDGIEHQPVYTIEEMEALPIPADVMVAKNLFLRDAKGRRHFLVVLRKDRPADLRGLEQALASGRLSFASEERLQKYLGLGKGSVSPLGILNDAGALVEVVVDATLADSARIGVHPNDNAATLFITYGDMVKVIQQHGNSITYI